MRFLRFFETIGEEDNSCVGTADLHRGTLRLPGGQCLCLDELCAGLTPDEGRIFLKKVRLPCMTKAEKLSDIRKLLEMEYRPAIARGQLSAMKDQLRRFNKETLDNWGRAQDVLAAVYAPDMERYRGRDLSDYKALSSLQEAMDDLITYMESYITTLELNETGSSQERYTCLADYFTRVFPAKSGDTAQNIPAFLDQPWVIFQLVRSPVHWKERRNDLDVAGFQWRRSFPL